MAFCIQNGDFRTRIANLYGSQPSSEFVACKTATLEPDLQVSMGPRHLQWFFASKRATLAPELRVSMCPRPNLLLCAC